MVDDRRRERVETVLRAIFVEIRTERITFMAGSIAYHAFVSLLPLLLLLLAIVATVGDQTLEQSLISFTEVVLTPGANEVLVAELEDATRSSELSVVGLIVLVWGTLRIFRGLDTAFSDIYESEAENTILDQFGDGVLVLVTFGFAVIAGAVVESTVSPSGSGFLPWLARRLLLVVGLAVALFPIYYVFPDEDVGLLEVVPGTLLTAVGLTAFESLFRLYIDYSARSPDANAVTAILVLLTWLYFSGLVVLLGAVVNAVLSNRSSDVQLRPVLGGVPLSASDDVVDRSSLRDDLSELERLDTVRPWTVSTGDGAVTLAPPDEVHVATGRRVRDDVTVELIWSPRGGADVAAAGRSAGTASTRSTETDATQSARTGDERPAAGDR